MFSYELCVNGAAVRVAVAQLDDGLFRATVEGDNKIQAHGRSAMEAGWKAALRASFQSDVEAA